MSFFRDADELRDEALGSVADFLRVANAPGSAAGAEERALCTQLLLELAVARGSLKFTLGVIENLDETAVLDASLLTTVTSQFPLVRTRTEGTPVSSHDWGALT